MNDELAEKVFTYIENLASLKKIILPKKGLLAGGSVSNLIFSFTHNHPPIVNDIDIFTLTQSKNRSSYEYNSIMESFYIAFNSREKILNNISLAPMDSKVFSMKREDQYKLILNNFDLNCCQAGIDLETRELFTTHHFDNFLLTKNIYTVNFGSPGLTAFRLLSKVEDLNCTSNIDEQILLLSQPFNIKNKGFPLPEPAMFKSKNIYQFTAKVSLLEDNSTNKKKIKKIAEKISRPLDFSYLISNSPKYSKNINKLNPYFHIFIPKDKDSQYINLFPKRRYLMKQFEDLNSFTSVNSLLKSYAELNIPCDSENIPF